MSKGCLAPKSGCGFRRANAVHGALPLILVACLWRRCPMIVWTTSRCCQSGQMISLVPEDNPVLSLSFHNAPLRHKGGGVDVCGLLYPHTAWCPGWGSLQRPKIRSSIFWLTRLILTFWQVSQDQAFLDSALGQGWAQKGWEYSSFRCLFLCVWVV